MLTIGVDAHKRTNMAVAIDAAGREVARWRGPNSVDGWRQLAAWAAALGADARHWALTGGEDHALLATVPLGAVDALADRGVVVVGRVREGGGVTDLAGTPLTPSGWEHWT